MGDVLILPLIQGRQVRGKKLPKAKDCADCGEPVETARLQVMPSARRCIECETERAKRHQRVLGGMRDKDIAIIRG